MSTKLPPNGDGCFTNFIAHTDDYVTAMSGGDGIFASKTKCSMLSIAVCKSTPQCIHLDFATEH